MKLPSAQQALLSVCLCFSASVLQAFEFPHAIILFPCPLLPPQQQPLRVLSVFLCLVD